MIRAGWYLRMHWETSMMQQKNLSTWWRCFKGSWARVSKLFAAKTGAGLLTLHSSSTAGGMVFKENWVPLYSWAARDERTIRKGNRWNGAHIVACLKVASVLVGRGIRNSGLLETNSIYEAGRTEDPIWVLYGWTPVSLSAHLWPPRVLSYYKGNSTQLDAKAECMALVGKKNQANAYRLCLPDTMRIVIGSDVIFDESSGSIISDEEVARSSSLIEITS